jgi:hypothetical protein
MLPTSKIPSDKYSDLFTRNSAGGFQFIPVKEAPDRSAFSDV